MNGIGPNMQVATCLIGGLNTPIRRFDVPADQATREGSEALLVHVL